MEIYLIHNPTQVQERAPASQYTRAKTIFPYSLQFCSLPSIFHQSTDTSPREGIIPRKFKRGNSKKIIIITKSYKSRVKRGTKLLFSYQLIYINDRQFSRLLRYTQTTTHTVPPNAAPHTIQRIASNNIQQQNTRSIAFHISSATGHLHYPDSNAITIPQIKL